MNYGNIIETCKKCGKKFKPFKYEPRYDMYGMMGNGWTRYPLCDECWEAKES